MFKKKKYKNKGSSIGVIGSIDGPTAIYITNTSMNKDISKLGLGKGLFKWSLNLIKNNGK